MPWEIAKRGDEYCVVKEGDGEVEGCHATRGKAIDQLRALNASESMDKARNLFIDDDSKYELPVTFEEMEERERAWKIANAIDEKVIEFHMLVDNVMFSDEVPPELKGTAILGLAKELASMLSTPEMLISKEKWSTAYINELPDSSFLFVESGGQKEGGKTTPRTLRHLPYKDKEGKVDLPHLRNAISRASQIKLKDGSTISDAKAKQIQAKAQRLLESNSEKDKLGDNEFLIYKDSSGTIRWVARYSNNFRDDDQPAEIISAQSHRYFYDQVQKGIVSPPELWLWHNPDWKFGEAEWVALDETKEGVVFTLAGGIIYPEHEELAMALQKSASLFKVSHGMPKWSVERDADDPTVIVKHITREISPLPAWAAANRWTGFSVIEDKENNAMAISPEDKARLLGQPGISKGLIDRLESANKADTTKAISEEIETKAKTEDVDETKAAPAMVEEDDEEEMMDDAKKASSDDEFTQLVKAVGTTLEMVVGFQKSVEVIETAVKNLGERIETLEEGISKEKAASTVESTPMASLLDLVSKAQSAIGQPEAKVDGRTSLAKDGPAEAPENPVAKRTGIPIVDAMIQGGK